MDVPSSDDQNPLGLSAEAHADFASARQVVIVARHGDRYDYASESWAYTVNELGIGHERDPPLSALGHTQARRMCNAVQRACVRRPPECRNRVACSPYLRCIQTAIGAARALGTSLEIEAGLAEVYHRPSYVPSLDERFRYFPEVNLAAESSEWFDKDQGEDELFPERYLDRIATFSANLFSYLDGDTRTSTTLLVSHAASVAVVACLTGIELDHTFSFAPAGVYVLARYHESQHFIILRDGATNAPYISSNSQTTTPCAMFQPDYMERWLQHQPYYASFPPPNLYPPQRPDESQA